MQSLTAKVIPLQTRRASRLTTQTFTQSLDVKGRGGEIDMRFHRVALEADGSTGNGMRQRDEPMRESIRSGGVTVRGCPRGRHSTIVFRAGGKQIILEISARPSGVLAS